MKVEKLLKSLLLFVCSMTMALNFTACSDDDDLITLVTYTVKGNISASSSDALESMFAIADYTEAIKKELGNYCFNTEKDNEVISVCDVVYQNHRTNHPTWKGVVEIEKSKVGTSGDVVSSTIIKTYNSITIFNNVYVSKMIEYIKANFSSNISLAGVAEVCSVSREHLSRTFKQETGYCFSEYLTLVRLKHAEYLLKNDNLSIIETANRCGFGDSNYFSFVFKKNYGVSPSKFKETL